MSLSQPIVQAVVKALEKGIDSSISTFIGRLAAKYGLERAALMEEWAGVSQGDVDNSAGGVVDTGELLKANKAELAQMCKERGLPCSGTKEVLRKRLINVGGDNDNTTAPKAKNAQPKVAKKTTILEKIEKKRPLIVPEQSEFGNWIHAETRLTFDTSSGQVVGRENDDGVVEDLTPADIEQCNRYGLNYTIPENLDKKVGLSEVHVDGLEEDESDEESECEYEEEIVEEELIEEGLIEEFGEDSEDEYEDYEEDDE